MGVDRQSQMQLFNLSQAGPLGRSLAHGLIEKLLSHMTYKKYESISAYMNTCIRKAWERTHYGDHHPDWAPHGYYFEWADNRVTTIDSSIFIIFKPAYRKWWTSLDNLSGDRFADRFVLLVFNSFLSPFFGDLWTASDINSSRLSAAKKNILKTLGSLYLWAAAAPADLLRRSSGCSQLGESFRSVVASKSIESTNSNKSPWQINQKTFRIDVKT